jgi:hypothetical protein
MMSMENPRRDSISGGGGGAATATSSVFGDPNLFGTSSDLPSTSCSSPSSTLLSKPLTSAPPMTTATATTNVMGTMMTQTNVQTESPASFRVVDLPTTMVGGGYVQGGYGVGAESQQQQ